MIWRGLQVILVVGITALGAAPCFGQYNTNWPTRVFVSNHPNAVFNGAYLAVGNIANEAGRVWQRYSEGESTTYWLGLYTEPGFRGVRVFTNYPTSILSGQVAQMSYGNLAGWPTAITTFQNVTVGGVQGPAGVSLVWDNSADIPYLQNFPDWESAKVKIPLGFGFGLGMWAIMLAAGVPLMFVRQLTNSAT